LLHGLQSVVPNPEAYLQDILDWTGGQPFLSQKLCYLLQATSTLEQPVAVAEVVHLQIIEQWETQDEPEHLRTIRDRLLRDPQQSVRLLGIYQDLLQRGEVPFDGSPAQMELRLTGLVVEQQGMLRIYNRVYAAVFDLNWVQSQLANIRPYADPLAHWAQSQGQSEAFLLRGEALKNALTWALGKSLSDLDYQYLVASQNLDKQQTQTMLHATEQASQMLSEARQQTRQAIAKWRIGWPWLPGLMLGSTLIIGSLKLSGLLQGAEWAALDQFFRWRPVDPPDPQIVVVTIDESDITALGQWPVSDRVLTQALETIKTAQPAAIGLDIYRNLKVEPGHGELQTVFASTSNLFGIEKLVYPAVPPPPLLRQKHQVGFSDQILDADNRVRRALLSMTSADQRDRLSLATLIALHYLDSKGIRQQELDPEGQRVRLGKTIFHRFQSSDGGYVRANPGGYQILLNWSGSQPQFQTVSFRDVLARRIPPEQWRDRIVLIGTTAASAKDEFLTPFSRGLFESPISMPGVFVHANIASQLIQAALAGRSPLRIWPDPLEWLWVLAWAGVGTVLGGWCWRSLMALVIVLTMAVGGLVGISYFIFLQSWWVPLIPAGGALFVSMALLRHVSLLQQEQFQFARILQILVEKQQDNPLAGHIALEYFKQSESQHHQRLIERQLGALRIEPVVQLNAKIDSKLLRSLDRGEKIASN
jgi:adenylate cyclase